MINHAVPAFAERRLNDIKPSDCQRYLQHRRQAVAGNPGRKNPQRISEGTVQRERRFLQAIFSRAVDDGLIERKPVEGYRANP